MTQLEGNNKKVNPAGSANEPVETTATTANPFAKGESAQPTPAISDTPVFQTTLRQETDAAAHKFLDGIWQEREQPRKREKEDEVTSQAFGIASTPTARGEANVRPQPAEVVKPIGSLARISHVDEEQVINKSLSTTPGVKVTDLNQEKRIVGLNQEKTTIGGGVKEPLNRTTFGDVAESLTSLAQGSRSADLKLTTKQSSAEGLVSTPRVDVQPLVKTGKTDGFDPTPTPRLDVQPLIKTVKMDGSDTTPMPRLDSQPTIKIAKTEGFDPTLRTEARPSIQTQTVQGPVERVSTGSGTGVIKDAVVFEDRVKPYVNADPGLLKYRTEPAPSGDVNVIHNKNFTPTSMDVPPIVGKPQGIAFVEARKPEYGTGVAANILPAKLTDGRAVSEPSVIAGQGVATRVEPFFSRPEGVTSVPMQSQRTEPRTDLRNELRTEPKIESLFGKDKSLVQTGTTSYASFGSADEIRYAKKMASEPPVVSGSGFARVQEINSMESAAMKAAIRQQGGDVAQTQINMVQTKNFELGKPYNPNAVNSEVPIKTYTGNKIAAELGTSVSDYKAQLGGADLGRKSALTDMMMPNSAITKSINLQEGPRPFYDGINGKPAIVYPKPIEGIGAPFKDPSVVKPEVIKPFTGPEIGSSVGRIEPALGPSKFEKVISGSEPRPIVGEFTPGPNRIEGSLAGEIYKHQKISLTEAGGASAADRNQVPGLTKTPIGQIDAGATKPLPNEGGSRINDLTQIGRNDKIAIDNSVRTPGTNVPAEQTRPNGTGSGSSADGSVTGVNNGDRRPTTPGTPVVVAPENGAKVTAPGTTPSEGTYKPAPGTPVEARPGVPAQDGNLRPAQTPGVTGDPGKHNGTETVTRTPGSNVEAPKVNGTPATDSRVGSTAPGAGKLTDVAAAKVPAGTQVADSRPGTPVGDAGRGTTFGDTRLGAPVRPADTTIAADTNAGRNQIRANSVDPVTAFEQSTQRIRQLTEGRSGETVKSGPLETALAGRVTQVRDFSTESGARLDGGRNQTVRAENNNDVRAEIGKLAGTNRGINAANNGIDGNGRRGVEPISAGREQPITNFEPQGKQIAKFEPTGKSIDARDPHVRVDAAGTSAGIGGRIPLSGSVRVADFQPGSTGQATGADGRVIGDIGRMPGVRGFAQAGDGRSFVSHAEIRAPRGETHRYITGLELALILSIAGIAKLRMDGRSNAARLEGRNWSITRQNGRPLIYVDGRQNAFQPQRGFGKGDGSSFRIMISTSGDQAAKLSTRTMRSMDIAQTKTTDATSRNGLNLGLLGRYHYLNYFGKNMPAMNYYGQFRSTSYTGSMGLAFVMAASGMTRPAGGMETQQGLDKLNPVTMGPADRIRMQSQNGLLTQFGRFNLDAALGGAANGRDLGQKDGKEDKKDNSLSALDDYQDFLARLDGFAKKKEDNEDEESVIINRKLSFGVEKLYDEASEEDEKVEEVNEEDTTNGSPLSQVLRRPKWVVQQGDTLDGLAERFFSNADLGWLIADLNRSLLRETFMDNKRIVEIQGRQEIELPVWQDIQKFTQNRKKNWTAENLVTIIVERQIDREVVESVLGKVVGV
jgi:hypothetical protein